MRVWEQTVTIAFHQADPAGVLFFARLFDLAHDAYEAWMRQWGHPLNLERPLPLVHAEADYLRPMRFGDRLRLQLTVVEVGRSRFVLECCFLGTVGDDVMRARVRTVHVAVDPVSGAAMALDAELRDFLAGGMA
ncbi:MAG: acyl-CoA thioesterase [Magnetococcus sp. WYHC-3]